MSILKILIKKGATIINSTFKSFVFCIGLLSLATANAAPRFSIDLERSYVSDLQRLEAIERHFKQSVSRTIEGATTVLENKKGGRLSQQERAIVDFIIECLIASTSVYPLPIRVRYMELVIDEGMIDARNIFEEYLYSESVKGNITPEEINRLSTRQIQIYDSCKYVAKELPDQFLKQR